MKSLQSKRWLIGLVCQVMVVGFSLPAFGQGEVIERDNVRRCPGAPDGFSSGLVKKADCENKTGWDSKDYKCSCDQDVTVGTKSRDFACKWTKEPNRIADDLGKCSIDAATVKQTCTVNGEEIKDISQCKTKAEEYCEQKCAPPTSEDLPINSIDKNVVPGISQ